MVMLQLRQLVVHPGQRVQLQEVNWPEFEAILNELGDRRASRIAYSNGVLEIRMPLPEDEVDMINVSILKTIVPCGEKGDLI